jgi:TrmH family RNA methyltransferase
VIRPDLRISARNARFQQWQALLDNRTKRTRSGEFLVQGVRPITLAVRNGWPLRALIYAAERGLSDWATTVLTDADPGVERVAMAPELLAELAQKSDERPELLAVAALPTDELSRIPLTGNSSDSSSDSSSGNRSGNRSGRDAGTGFLGLVFDRPTSPGNIGTVVRSADAFGANGMIVAGHAADPYDPKAVRASTGSLFALPVVRVPAPATVLDWLTRLRREGLAVQLVGTDETGSADLAEFDLAQPTLLVLGNETSGMSAAWREACDAVVRIPIGGSASSLNAANAASVVLYEAARQRRSC